MPHSVALHCSLEMWSFELIVLLSGLLPNPQLETSVLSIRLQFEVTDRSKAKVYLCECLLIAEHR